MPQAHADAPHPARLSNRLLDAAGVATNVDLLLDELATLLILARRNPGIFWFDPWHMWPKYAIVAQKESGERRFLLVATAADLMSIFDQVVDLVGSIQELVSAELRVDRMFSMDIQIQGRLAQMDQHLGSIQGLGGLESLRSVVAAELAAELVDGAGS